MTRLNEGLPYPNIAFVCKTISHETLAVWYSCNTFTLTPFTDYTPAASLAFTSRWRAALGKRVKHLRHLVCKQTHRDALGNVFAFAYTFCLATRASVSLTRRVPVASPWGSDEYFTKQYCVCELERRLKDVMPQESGYDGSILLSVVEHLLADAREPFEEVQCTECERPKLATPAAVRAQTRMFGRLVARP